MVLRSALILHQGQCLPVPVTTVSNDWVVERRFPRKLFHRKVPKELISSWQESNLLPISLTTKRQGQVNSNIVPSICFISITRATVMY